MPHRISQFLVVAAVCAPMIAGAQATPLSRGERFADASLSLSFFTDRGPHFALLRNRKVVMLGFKKERVFAVGKHFAWASTIEVPVSLILPPENAPSAECWRRISTGKQECYALSNPNYPVGAVGLTPLGLKAYFGPSSRLRLFGALAGGLVAFDRKTPVAAASALNFSAEFLVGAEFGVSSQRAIELAWKFQHWSNANTTHFNPGLDVNLVTVGLKRRR
jgi:hypothetical protein